MPYFEEFKKSFSAKNAIYWIVAKVLKFKMLSKHIKAAMRELC